MFLPQHLLHLCSYAPKLRSILDGPSNMQTMFESLSTIQDDAKRRSSIILWTKNNGTTTLAPA
jgi:hypothetical protein